LRYSVAMSAIRTAPVVTFIVMLMLWVCAATGSKAQERPPATVSGKAAAPARQSPADVLRSLYRLHNKGYGPVFDRKGRPHLDRYFDKPLADLIWKNIIGPPSGEVGNLDFDPLFNAQDVKLTELHIGEARIQRNRASSVVTFKNYDQPVRLTFHLRRTGNGWKIRDIDYGKGESLVKILSKPWD
jgi:hypothetical protein